MQIPFSTFAGLGTLRDQTTVLVHTHQRENQISLYGFLTPRENKCFELLIDMSGVGPSLALKILSGLEVDELTSAIGKGDLQKLVAIQGVGRKTAERIILELKDKMAAVSLVADGRSAAKSQLQADVFSALINLGYDARSAENAAKSSSVERETNFEELLRASLGVLGGSSAQKPESI